MSSKISLVVISHLPSTDADKMASITRKLDSGELGVQAVSLFPYIGLVHTLTDHLRVTRALPRASLLIYFTNSAEGIDKAGMVRVLRRVDWKTIVVFIVDPPDPESWLHEIEPPPNVKGRFRVVAADQIDELLAEIGRWLEISRLGS